MTVWEMREKFTACTMHNHTRPLPIGLVGRMVKNNHYYTVHSNWKQKAGKGGGKCWPDAAKCASCAFPILGNLTSLLKLATHAIASSLRGSTMDGQ